MRPWQLLLAALASTTVACAGDERPEAVGVSLGPIKDASAPGKRTDASTSNPQDDAGVDASPPVDCALYQYVASGEECGTCTPITCLCGGPPVSVTQCTYDGCLVQANCAVVCTYPLDDAMRCTSEYTVYGQEPEAGPPDAADDVAQDAPQEEAGLEAGPLDAALDASGKLPKPQCAGLNVPADWRTCKTEDVCPAHSCTCADGTGYFARGCDGAHCVSSNVELCNAFCEQRGGQSSSLLDDNYPCKNATDPTSCKECRAAAKQCNAEACQAERNALLFCIAKNDLGVPDCLVPRDFEFVTAEDCRTQADAHRACMMTSCPEFAACADTSGFPSVM